MLPDLQDIVDEVAQLLGAPATLEDRDFNLVAFGAHGVEIDEVRQQSILRRKASAEVRAWFEQFGIATSDTPVRTPASRELGVLGRLCIPVRWNGVTYGYLWLLDDRNEIDETQLPAAMVLADRAAVLMAQQARARQDLALRLGDLLSPYPEVVERAAAELDDLGVLSRGVPVVVVVLGTTGSTGRKTTPINLWGLPRSVLAAPGEDHTTLLVPLSTSGDLGPARKIARRAWELYAEQLDPAQRTCLVAGVGSPRPDLAQARASYQQARLAVRVGQVVPEHRPVAEWAALGVHRLLACGPDQALREAVLGTAVRRLLTAADPELRRTAEVYLAEAGNAQRTAAALGIHRQTLYYRLGRIEKITGLCLSRGQDRLELHLGLTMARVLDPEP
ncbi:MAG TPA: helix-turn-helix domain-containing protein [Pseudonocardiaceae bacterium]